MSPVTWRQLLRTQVYPVTRGICVGPFASRPRQADLRECGVTHVLNVSESPSLPVEEGAGFIEVAWLPVGDLTRIPDETARECLETLQRMLVLPGSRVYVHCIAGRNRSPTVVWLYLVACGCDAAEARRWITERSPDAVPAHPLLVDGRLVEFARRHGAARFLPHPRAEVLELAPLPG
jgi:protein-tyrosine phosphatase